MQSLTTWAGCFSHSASEHGYGALVAWVGASYSNGLILISVVVDGALSEHIKQLAQQDPIGRWADYMNLQIKHNGPNLEGNVTSEA